MTLEKVLGPPEGNTGSPGNTYAEDIEEQTSSDCPRPTASCFSEVPDAYMARGMMGGDLIVILVVFFVYKENQTTGCTPVVPVTDTTEKSHGGRSRLLQLSIAYQKGSYRR